MDRQQPLPLVTLTRPNGCTSDQKLSPPSGPVSAWNFLSLARDRISSLASSLQSGDSQSILSSRRGSWSPADAPAASFYFHHKNEQNAALGQKGLYIYSIETDYSSTNPPLGMSRADLSRRSTQSLRNLKNLEDLPNFGTAGTNKGKKGANYQTTSFMAPPQTATTTTTKAKHGSLESVDFDDSSSTSSECESEALFSTSFGSSSSSSFMRSTSGLLSDYRATSARLDCAFARALGYHDLDEIELYHELHKMILSRKRPGYISTEPPPEPQPESGSGCGRGCSKSVTRFGLGYEDHCMFPLVLPVFLNDCLQKRSTAYVTWDYIKLQADAELCRWEYASLQNLSRRFSSTPITGAPIHNICPDPNLFLRNLAYQLVIEGNFRSMKVRESNRALKRWTSVEDLLGSGGSAGTRVRKLEPEFVGARSYRASQCFTDESLALGSNWETKTNGGQLLNKSASTGSGTRVFGSNHKSPSQSSFLSNSQVYRELASLVEALSPVQLALYLSRFYLKQMKTGFTVQMFAQLVLVKDLSSLDRTSVNRKMRQTLLNLLTFDDTLVAVIGDHFRRAQAQQSVEGQTRALASMIETGCLLRQLRNFYGLKVVMGALQSLTVYAGMDEAWKQLAYRMPVHFRDYHRLCRLARKLDHSIIGTNQPHIPTLSSLINRLKLCCSVSWDLFEAKRRFVEHPSIAGWLHTEALGSYRTNLRNLDLPDLADSAKPLLARLSYDPISDSYLPTASDPIRLIGWHEFPATWRGRFVPAIPERYLRTLLQTRAFANMVECFFRDPISRYQLASD